MKLWVVVLFLASACGAVPVANATPTASSSPIQASPHYSPVYAAPRSAVLAIVGGPKRSTISLVDSNGAVLASARVDPAALVVHSFMSWTSASLTRLYFLNAGTEVRFLAPDGSSGTATRIPVAANEQAGFAVSPDNKRIAVSIFTYSPSFSGMRLYVEDLQGGGDHVDIFASPTAAEFPIGWTSGRLVVAVSSSDCCKATMVNPYGATSYHVVDPANGNRLVSLCDAGNVPGGSIEPVGVICGGEYAGPLFEHWDGTTFPTPAAIAVSVQYFGAISPDGTRFAWGGDPISVEIPLDIRLDWVGRGYVLGWLDADRFIYAPGLGGPLRVYDVNPDTPMDIARPFVSSPTDLAPSGNTYLGTFPPPIS
jgi:hypothetical protein